MYFWECDTFCFVQEVRILLAHSMPHVKAGMMSIFKGN